MADRSWMPRGACFHTDPARFVPASEAAEEDAKQVCARCDVRVECLAYALEQGEGLGVWGGTTAAERRGIQQAARRTAIPRE